MAKKSSQAQGELFRKWLAGEYHKKLPLRQTSIVSSGGEVVPTEDDRGPLVRVPRNEIIDWLVSKEIDPTQAIDTAIEAGWISPIGSILEDTFFRWVSAKVLNIKPNLVEVERKASNEKYTSQQLEQFSAWWKQYSEKLGKNRCTHKGFLEWGESTGAVDFPCSLTEVELLKRALRHRRNT